METRTGKELAGLAVMTLTGGERLGRVEDVIFAPSTGHVLGFLVDRGGMFSKPKFLPSAEVKSVGADALTVTGEEALTETSLDPAALASKSLDGRAVLNESGTVIGKVADISIDTDGLRALSLILSTGLLDNALHGRPLLPLILVQTIGPDSVIVSNSYDPKSPTTHA